MNHSTAPHWSYTLLIWMPGLHNTAQSYKSSQKTGSHSAKNNQLCDKSKSNRLPTLASTPVFVPIQCPWTIDVIGQQVKEQSKPHIVELKGNVQIFQQRSKLDACKQQLGTFSVSLSCYVEYCTKQWSPALPFERKVWNHLPVSQSISGNFTSQWDTALVQQVQDNGAFQAYKFQSK